MPGFWITFVSNIYSLDLQRKESKEQESRPGEAATEGS